MAAYDVSYKITHRSSVGRAGDCNVFVIPRSLVRIRPVRYLQLILVGWPSGLRRQVKALISSEARVRIPSQPLCNNFFFIIIIIIMLIDFYA